MVERTNRTMPGLSDNRPAIRKVTKITIWLRSIMPCATRTTTTMLMMRIHTLFIQFFDSSHTFSWNVKILSLSSISGHGIMKQGLFKVYPVRWAPPRLHFQIPFFQPFILAIGWVRVLKPFSLLILKGENVKWSVTRLCKCEDVDCCTFCRQHDNDTLRSGKSEIYPKRKTKLSSYLFDILLFQYGHQFHDLCPNWSELQLQRCEPIINNGLRSLARQTDTYAFGPHLLIYDYHQIWSQINFLKTRQKSLGIKILSSRTSTVWRQIANFFLHFCPQIGLGKESKITNTTITR